MFLLAIIPDSFADYEDDQSRYDDNGNVPGIQHVDRRRTQCLLLGPIDLVAVETATNREEIRDLLKDMEFLQ